ncbi:RES family NAD+ phosphorylase [Acuticoccus mangrovi]|uniref:RES family NAD+ phosphorylase n=1 Tax=Acuticoccus mangrovi TaxID=2796142 RepID=A0A934ITK7_9HYPH|nr:RES family NAD+ phosphorylase [Acuticoccus mangrovi]MBJ3777780.1 RES family NAD+ phosphorylase [Acuticoccus mangrovi]
MSSPIWTPDALSSEARPYKGEGWRLVEAQHRVSTLDLVDTVAEQTLLEDILEETKPPLPEACRGLDYLLAAPFRYAPYPHGSRFRRAGWTDGVFYAAETVEAAVAEMVFYRLLFYAESPDTPMPTGAAEYTAFAARLGTDRAIDLAMPPFAREAPRWTDPVDYGACQALADAARPAGVEIIRYLSVRDPAGGANLAVLSPTAFRARAPVKRQSWRIRVGPGTAQAVCEHPRVGIDFPAGTFAADPRLAGF